MGEKRIIADKLRNDYEGLFNFNELYRLIVNWFKDKGYDRREKYAHEKVTKTGKYVEIELQPWKSMTDYVKSEIRVHIIASDMRDAEVVIDNTKQKLNEGKIHIVLDAFLVTDYEGKWEMRPVYYFLKTVFEKFAFSPQISKYEGAVNEDVTDLHNQIKGYLNLYKYGPSQTAPAGKPKDQF